MNLPSQIFFTASMVALALWIIRKLVFIVRVLTTKKRCKPRKILPRTYDV